MVIINLSNFKAKIRRWKGIMVARRRFIAFGTRTNVSKGLRGRRLLGSKKKIGIWRNEGERVTGFESGRSWISTGGVRKESPQRFLSSGERNLLASVEGLLNGEVIHRQAVDDEGETRITMVGEDVKRFDVRRAKPLVGLARFLGGEKSIELDFPLLGGRETESWAREEVIGNPTVYSGTEKRSKLRN